MRQPDEQNSNEHDCRYDYPLDNLLRLEFSLCFLFGFCCVTPLPAIVGWLRIVLKFMATFGAEVHVVGHVCTAYITMLHLDACFRFFTSSNPMFMRMSTTTHTTRISAVSFIYPPSIGASQIP